MGPHGTTGAASLTKPDRVDKIREGFPEEGALGLSPEGSGFQAGGAKTKDKGEHSALGVCEQFESHGRGVCRDGRETRVNRGQAVEGIYVPGREVCSLFYIHLIKSVF